MSLVQFFLKSFRSADDMEPGLFEKNDGTVWLRNPDGSETQVTGGGGGSQNLGQVLTAGNDGAGLQIKHLAVGTDPSDAATVSQLGGGGSAGFGLSLSIVLPLLTINQPDGAAFTPDSSTCYVPSASDNTVTPIDTATFTAGEPISVGTGPENICVTPDGTKAYVTNHAEGTVTPITLPANTPGAPITVGNGPYGIAVTPDGTKVYVANEGDGTVTPINVADNTPGEPITVGNQPAELAVTPDGSTCYVANGGDGTVTPITVADDTAGDPITVANAPYGIAITPDGATAYVTDAGDGSVTPINVGDNTPGAPIATGFNVAEIPAIDPTGTTLYVPNAGSDGGIALIDIATETVIGILPTISNASAVVASADGKYVYVTCNGDATGVASLVRVPFYTLV